jgi:thiamine-phosphate pyrophosphorylase
MTQGLPRIWIITDPDHPDGPVAPLRRALENCPPGLVGIQLRAPGVPDRQLIDWGLELRALTQAQGCALTVNRRIDVAEIVGADGVHLSESGLPLNELREHWPAIQLLGVSRHGSVGVAAAELGGASYAYLSPVFAVPGKAAPIGIHGFRAAIADVGIPTFALGGIKAEDLKPLFAAGAFGVALRRAIYSSNRPEESLSRFLSALDKAFANGE